VFFFAFRSPASEASFNLNISPSIIPRPCTSSSVTLSPCPFSSFHGFSFCRLNRLDVSHTSCFRIPLYDHICPGCCPPSAKLAYPPSALSTQTIDPYRIRLFSDRFTPVSQTLHLTISFPGADRLSRSSGQRPRRSRSVLTFFPSTSALTRGPSCSIFSFDVLYERAPLDPFCCPSARSHSLHSDVVLPMCSLFPPRSASLEPLSLTLVRQELFLPSDTPTGSNPVCFHPSPFKWVSSLPSCFLASRNPNSCPSSTPPILVSR